jgi:hypothetical protein
MTQQEAILAHCREYGSITRFGAVMNCGVFELSSRIGELERKGFVFMRAREQHRTRYGRTTTVTRYTYLGKERVW